MKVFISVDLEGVNGVVSPSQVLPGNLEYDRTRKLVTDEVNAAVLGALEAGASEILVNDSHNDMCNIDITRLHPRAKLILGDSKKYSMVHGADATFDAAIFLGYHAKAGTPYAIMDHSFYPKEVLDIRINGVSYGEIGLNMLFLAEIGVPVVMVTGDRAAIEETLSLNPWCKTVCVKEAQGRFSAKCIPIEDSLSRIKETAKEALSFKQKKILRVPKNPVLEIEFASPNLTDAAGIVPGVERVNARSISFRCSNIRDLYMWRQVFCALASKAYDEHY